jgi:hypothetical protein
MKKTITTTAVIVGYFILMSTLGIIAAVPGHSQKSANAKETVRREIIRNISCPDFVAADGEIHEVRAIVNVDNKGEVSIEQINSANEQLKDYVLNQLENLKVQTGSAERFVLVIKFKAA